MVESITRNIYVVGRDIDTDAMIPARHLNTMDAAYLGKHAMEDLDPKKYPIPFLNKDGSCDYQVLVAGHNVGCGSSREHAPIALHAAGIQAVIAPSFARIFYRNCVNGGILLPLVSKADLSEILKTGERVSINLGESPRIEEICDSQPRTWELKPFGPVKKIIEAGGLTAYNMKRLGLA